MGRSTGVLAAIMLSVVFGACSPGAEQIDLDVSLDLRRSAKADSAGPSTSCNISYELEIASDGPEGFYQHSCEVEALNDDGHAVLRTLILPVSRTETLGAGQPPYSDVGILPIERILFPQARRSITTLTGSCDAFRLVGGPIA